MERATLKSYRIPRKDVPTSDGVYSVRGVSVADLVTVFIEHRDDMSALYDRAMLGQIPIEKEAALLQTIGAAPNLVASIIALAVDEPDEWMICLTMPIGDQIALADAILALTFGGAGGLKKAIETVKLALLSDGQTSVN